MAGIADGTRGGRQRDHIVGKDIESVECRGFEARRVVFVSLSHFCLPYVEICRDYAPRRGSGDKR
ncbi:hypothetical protein SRABI05_04031 [Agrobacterium fabrum]|jgi:hypothetical protein|nr:hypothetical protein SRABI46_04003 [Agrobacterium fabrum]CAH0289380.1 hypothetical protein SRABI05_04031 [Agrobacterium fabrum]